MITRILRLMLAAALAVAGVGLALVPAQAAPASSAVTVSGTGDFASLKVTVGQTTNLINQTVHVSWTGGAPTGPEGNFYTNFLQIMQCWGDDPAGPDRAQCQYGGLATQTNPASGAFLRNRQLSYGNLIDPLEDPFDRTPGAAPVSVPFHSVTGVTTTSPGDFYTSGTTNEVPLAKTRIDGGGDLDFEVQTNTEAYGLGCGVVDQTTGRPRHCWLVLVPRSDKEVNGQVAGADYSHSWLDSSPLSKTNWSHRLQVRLDFQPVGSACPLGSAERLTAGHEFIAEAINRWQPKLCAGGGKVFGYTQLPDQVARGVLQSDKPGLDFITDPVPPGELTRPLVYAPVAMSGLSIAFMMERQSGGSGSGVGPEVWQRDGEQVTEMNLTPRLVAKLLTQSYRGALPGPADYLANNAVSLTLDPDFAAANQDLAPALKQIATVDALVSTVDYDQTAVLWSWINADPDARAFLDGKPDKWGMTVNPHYRGIALPVSTFPKADLSCFGTGLTETCALERHPLANDMHDAARAASRGDSLGKEPTNLKNPDGSKNLASVSRDPVGARRLIAITDTATAARYGLPAAKLRNTSGTFVAPTTESLLAGAAAMKDSGVDGVKVPNPTSTAAAAYPLTNISYAVTAPSALDTGAGADYATFIRYAVGDGQTPGIEPGQLPDGYVPLSEDLRRQARDSATKIADLAGKPVGTTDQAAGAGELSGSGGTADGSGGSASADTATSASTTAAPAAAPGPAKAAVPTQTLAQQQVAQSSPTPASPVGIVRWVLVALLALGALTAGGGPALLRLSGRRGR
ncbi:MAG TPA: hypothetical protein VJ870_21430 [Amycolatopsis sp.]|nr:hypothetical protein [Amycolatopsis sp.]